MTPKGCIEIFFDKFAPKKVGGSEMYLYLINLLERYGKYKYNKGYEAGRDRQKKVYFKGYEKGKEKALDKIGGWNESQ